MNIMVMEETLFSGIVADKAQRLIALKRQYAREQETVCAVHTFVQCENIFTGAVRVKMNVVRIFNGLFLQQTMKEADCFFYSGCSEHLGFIQKIVTVITLKNIVSARSKIVFWNALVGEIAFRAADALRPGAECRTLR